MKTLTLAIALSFFVAIVARPVIDPSCLAHHADTPRVALTSMDTDLQRPSAPASGPVHPGAGGHPHSIALMQACLCWFVGLTGSPSTFDAAATVAPTRETAHDPVYVARRPVPFALPFANGPPSLS